MSAMRMVYDIIITTMETLGLILVAAGLGVFASWVAGLAGFLVVTGGALLAAATLSARQQRANAAQPRAPVSSTLPPGWPPTRNAVNGSPPEAAKRKSLLDRFADWVYATK